jgi:hypothetical protein
MRCKMADDLEDAFIQSWQEVLSITPAGAWHGSIILSVSYDIGFVQKNSGVLVRQACFVRVGVSLDLWILLLHHCKQICHSTVQQSVIATLFTCLQ